MSAKRQYRAILDALQQGLQTGTSFTRVGTAVKWVLLAPLLFLVTAITALYATQLVAPEAANALEIMLTPTRPIIFWIAADIGTTLPFVIFAMFVGAVLVDTIVAYKKQGEPA